MVLGLGSSLVRQLGRPLFSVGMRAIAEQWQPYTRLFTVSDSPRWSISHDMRELQLIAHRLGVQVASPKWLRHTRHQSVFYGSHFHLLSTELLTSHRVGTAYFHGMPGTGIPDFDAFYKKLCQVHQHIDRIQVTHREMHELMLDAGVQAHKVFRIPIGVNLSYFLLQSRESCRDIRARYDLPQSATIIGSFQKDGQGWDDGLEPKLIKGPDVFLKTIEILKSRISELFVLLSGPARGYVKAGLERMAVPYRHIYLEEYAEVGQLFQALDAYVVASRQEGGPKAIFEAMASGVPIVTTRVGQAMDLVVHGKNGWMVDVEDAEGLAHWTQYIIEHHSQIQHVLFRGRQTAEANSYQAQIPLWREFMRDFVEINESYESHQTQDSAFI